AGSERTRWTLSSRLARRRWFIAAEILHRPNLLFRRVAPRSRAAKDPSPKTQSKAPNKRKPTPPHHGRRKAEDRSPGCREAFCFSSDQDCSGAPTRRHLTR